MIFFIFFKDRIFWNDFIVYNRFIELSFIDFDYIEVVIINKFLKYGNFVNFLI